MEKSSSFVNAEIQIEWLNSVPTIEKKLFQKNINDDGLNTVSIVEIAYKVNTKLESNEKTKQTLHFCDLSVWFNLIRLVNWNLLNIYWVDIWNAYWIAQLWAFRVKIHLTGFEWIESIWIVAWDKQSNKIRRCVRFARFRHFYWNLLNAILLGNVFLIICIHTFMDLQVKYERFIRSVGKKKYEKSSRINVDYYRVLSWDFCTIYGMD